jgi:hypothetical protein
MLHTRGSKHEGTNYRGTSLLDDMSKMYEKGARPPYVQALQASVRARSPIRECSRSSWVSTRIAAWEMSYMGSWKA